MRPLHPSRGSPAIGLDAGVNGLFRFVPVARNHVETKLVSDEFDQVESPTLTLRSRSRAGTSQQELGFAASFAMQKHDAMNCKGFICLLLSEDSQMPESR